MCGLRSEWRLGHCWCSCCRWHCRRRCLEDWSSSWAICEKRLPVSVVGRRIGLGYVAWETKAGQILYLQTEAWCCMLENTDLYSRRVVREEAPAPGSRRNAVITVS